MYPLIKSIHFLSLYFLLGGPAFWYLMWKPVMHDPMGAIGRRLYRSMSAGLLLGTFFFIGSALADALRAASQVVDVRDLDMLRLFFDATQFGRLTIVKCVLAVVTGFFFWLAPKRDREKSAFDLRRMAAKIVPVAGMFVGLGLLVTVSLASHAASKPGLFPILSDVVHLLSSIVWAGGVIYLSVLPWKDIQNERLEKPMAALVTRFSNMALLAVASVTATGVFAGFLHIASTMAIRETSYGRTLGFKIALFVVVMLIAGINIVFIGPNLRRSAATKDRDPYDRYRQTVRRLGALVRVEAVVIMVLLMVASALTTLPPPDTLGTVKETSWERVIGDYSATIRMVPVGAAGLVEIDIQLTGVDAEPAPSDLRVFAHLEMPSHPMGTRELKAQQILPGLYRATALISMVGHWQADVKVVFPDGTFEAAVFDFEAT